ncbi:MAG: alpha/beta fold hydrolase [Thermomicrobium sp.]|nr:alpha/beta fold hydrolase [Thermomicrobium sp.]
MRRLTRRTFLSTSLGLAVACRSRASPTQTPSLPSPTSSLGPGPSATSEPRPFPSPIATTPTPLPTATPVPAPTPTPHPLAAYTIEGLRARTYPGGTIELLRTVAETETYTYYHVRYPSDGLRITGGLHVPRRAGPFPVVVLCHGYIPPDQYWTGADTIQAADALARRGFLCLAPDFRGWGGSDPGPNYFRTGIVIDTLNAVSSLASLPQADPRRVGLWGHSMGGGLVAKVICIDDRIRGAVLYAPVSGWDLDNIRKWGDGARPDDPLGPIYAEAARDEGFLRATSPLFHFHFVACPVQIHIGTADTVTPPEWSRAMRDSLLLAGKSVEYFEYPGEGHAFSPPAWNLFVERIVDFYDRTLRGT